MNRTALENWIERTEALPNLTREGLEGLQLKKLNEMLVLWEKKSKKNLL